MAGGSRVWGQIRSIRLISLPDKVKKGDPLLFKVHIFTQYFLVVPTINN